MADFTLKLQIDDSTGIDEAALTEHLRRYFNKAAEAIDSQRIYTYPRKSKIYGETIIEVTANRHVVMPTEDKMRKLERMFGVTPPPNVIRLESD